jgi:hypothetical protein
VPGHERDPGGAEQGHDLAAIQEPTDRSVIRVHGPILPRPGAARNRAHHAA